MKKIFHTQIWSYCQLEKALPDIIYVDIRPPAGGGEVLSDDGPDDPVLHALEAVLDEDVKDSQLKHELV